MGAFRNRYCKDTVMDSIGRMSWPAAVAIKCTDSLPAEIDTSSSGLSLAGNRDTRSPSKSTKRPFSSAMSSDRNATIVYRRTTSPSRITVAWTSDSRNEQLLVPPPWLYIQVNLSTGTLECSSGPRRNIQDLEGRVSNSRVSTTSELCAFGGTS